MFLQCLKESTEVFRVSSYVTSVHIPPNPPVILNYSIVCWNKHYWLVLFQLNFSFMELFSSHWFGPIIKEDYNNSCGTILFTTLSQTSLVHFIFCALVQSVCFYPSLVDYTRPLVQKNGPSIPMSPFCTEIYKWETIESKKQSSICMYSSYYWACTHHCKTP